MPVLSLRSCDDTTELATLSFIVKRKQPVHFIITRTMVTHPSPPNFLSPFHPSRSSLLAPPLALPLLRCPPLFTLAFLFAFAFAHPLQVTVDKRALATIPTYDHSHGTTLSLTLYTLSFPTHSMLNATLDRSTPRAFTFLSAADNIISNRSSGLPLTTPERSPSIHSTLPSLFEPPESTRSTLRISTCMHHSHSLHAVAVQPQPPQPTQPQPTHTRNLTHRSRVTTKRGDEDYIKQPKDAFILF
ncbi:uncharacterized protein FOMMEDRAFT_151072 [Fomitiporia mediterranea MF3/22]|uniref:uncharacterized protein n=1 Tax=Fomitiporia mediterranea (strain MF3/22) TaxID=694068 RepID=UPI000440730C|nr:uncharacterized protein FOMMEDRAFT_151072 [Fomitiporia mediterranea MF3/22]EJD08309.1 hypothetical protein FOMMEDRAFT_151072 [Fomitiporia mediterranea MF3/22]